MSLKKVKEIVLKIRTAEIFSAVLIFTAVTAAELYMNVGIRTVAGIVVFLAALMIASYILVKVYFPQILRSPKNILLVETLVVLMLFFVIIIKFNQALPVYFLPVASAGILLSVLISPALSVVGVFIITAFMLTVTGFSFELFTIYFFGGIAGSYAARSVRNRRDLNRCGLYVLGVNTLTIGAFGLIGGGSIIDTGVNIAWGAGNAFVAIIIAGGLLPFYENIFKLTTDIKLLELGDFNHPVLKRLMLEAPGTYHHSLMVGNLAEHACQQIGANPLLARVSAYYHDIGKLKNPQYFIENQAEAANKHDNLKSNISALILKRHVKDGVKLARKHSLDQVIIDCIQQHHGTTLMGYFYDKVLKETDDKDGIDKDEFRYPGPLPGTKEGGVIMLADSVEAACRSLEEPSFSRISAVVTKIINNKFIDNQLSKCEITLANLEQIQKSFISTLSGIYHSRIEYPEDKEETSVEQ
ncbi:MAG: HDIG domain-containing protein [Elusimicrobiota bacterium]|nr:HDIG domain-containing protein [Elusimicrobiota bacterium]